MTVEPPSTHVAPDAGFIGAGDEVVILEGDRSGIYGEGILVDVEPDGRATVNLTMPDATGWVHASVLDIAHPDSPAAVAARS